MILVVYAPLSASGRILVMRTCNNSMILMHGIWKHLDGMMPFGKKLAWEILWMDIMLKLVILDYFPCPRIVGSVSKQN